MTLNELRFIVAVAQTRNFRRAAEHCFISQPALSLAIRKLEDELGLQIFERGPNEISLTPVGSDIVEQAQRVLDEAERLRAIAARGNDPLASPLRLGVIHSVGPYLLPELIPALKQLAPRMTLEVEESITAHLDTLLRNGSLDVAIVALPFGDDTMLTRPVYDEPFEAVVPVDHRWAKRRSLPATALADEQVLLLDNRHCFSNQVTEACPELNRRGAHIHHGTSLETLRNMAASGLGITVLPACANAVRYQSTLLRVVPFSKPVPTRRIALAWRKRFGRPGAIDVLAQAIALSPLRGIQHLESP